MILHPAQKEIVKCNNRFRVVCAGRRFGKSTLAIEEMFWHATTSDNARVCYIAPTHQSARDIVWNQLKKRVVDIASNINETRLEMTVKNNTGTTSFIALRSWDAVETLRGQFFNFIVLDEVAQYKNFSNGWDEVLRPTLTDKKGNALFISTPLGFNFFYDLYNLEAKDKDYKSFHFTSFDNPYLLKEELEKIKNELTEDRYAQEILADFRKTEGLVYKEFDRERHLFDFEPSNVVEYIAGIDFGFTNPCAVVHIKRDYDNNFWIVDEWYQTGRTEEQIADYVRSCQFNAVYPDPENPSAISVLNTKGINVCEVLKGKDSVQSGINRVRDLLKRNKLKIHKNCVNTIWELETYSYPPKKDLRNEYENPIKENDHLLDAIRMAVTNNQPEDPRDITRMSLLHQARRQSQINNAR
ncbi:MAG: hypothetical protein A2W05_07075 [Candidatus Schekmanbacteria bacterium RBG_16_38_10]|uniref:Phage terminase large subunit C-terminal domain-containing protein n=1 Tax=Candidatus Schekmanbacteria bacterium RBG_16_38_10 TaxID=1817879 RepID=A0A1F7RZI0_9BACT|nr:MAG: hypothetical protein A2W05_07075 [Candidatus Schekmanbacteria bacterium RBG_16_38_10]